MRAIKNRQDYERALALVEELFGADAGSQEAAELDRIAALVEEYEESRHRIAPPSVAAALEFRMDQQGLSQADVAALTGIAKSRVSEILSGKREPSKQMIRRLHEALGIPLQHLLGIADSEIWPTTVACEKPRTVFFEWRTTHRAFRESGIMMHVISSRQVWAQGGGGVVDFSECKEMIA